MSLSSGEGCLFPPEWTGSWFQRGVYGSIKITPHEISGKGFCKEITADFVNKVAAVLIENRSVSEDDVVLIYYHWTLFLSDPCLLCLLMILAKDECLFFPLNDLCLLLLLYHQRDAEKEREVLYKRMSIKRTGKQVLEKRKRRGDLWREMKGIQETKCTKTSLWVASKVGVLFFREPSLLEKFWTLVRDWLQTSIERERESSCLFFCRFFWRFYFIWISIPKNP